jgi:sugar O-acyltransferase (sialic acid O-acetyltransferase NeuD family)
VTKIIDILVPKETVSDDVYLVSKLYVSSGHKVKQGDLIASLETSKADFDIESSHSGYVFFNCKEGQKIKIGTVLGAISDTDTIAPDYFKTEPANPAPSNSIGDNPNKRISKKALRLIEENKIDISVFDHLSLVGTDDVEAYLNRNTNVKTEHALSENSDSNSSKIIIVGGGNHTKVCIDLIRQNHLFEIAGIVYTKYQPAYHELMGVPILGGLDKLPDLFSKGIRFAALGIGSLDNPSDRWAFFNQIKSEGFYLPNLIHPKSSIEPSATLGEGNQIMAGAVLGSCAHVLNNCIINSNAVVSHDCRLANNVHITPGAILAGTVTIGMHTVIGMGSSIFYGTSIGNSTIITNGKHIYKDIGSNEIIK